MKTSRSGGDGWFRIFLGAFAVLVLAVVVGIGIALFSESILSIRRFGINFWFTDVWDPVPHGNALTGQFGAKPFIWGTLYSSILALLIAGPISLGIATYLSELCPPKLRQPLIFLTELLAAIPSIVYGLWGVFVLVPLVRQLEIHTPESWRQFPLFSGPPLGLGMLSAALILAIMVTPFISSLAREVLKAVPRTQREGAYAVQHALSRRSDGRECAVRRGGRGNPRAQDHASVAGDGLLRAGRKSLGEGAAEEDATEEAGGEVIKTMDRICTAVLVVGTVYVVGS